MYYSSSRFFGNIIKVEGNLVKVEVKPYAQYNSVPQVIFIPKGKRKPMSYIASGYKPFVLILGGDGHPNPGDPFVPVQSKVDGAIVSKSQYASFDDRWESDFDSMINQYLASNPVKVIGDYRYTKGFSSY